MSWSIKVENLSKLYSVGSGARGTETLYTKIATRVKRLWSEEAATQDVSEKVLAAAENRILSPKQLQDAPPGRFWALKNISFEVQQGDRVAIVGVNGSGKSTLLKILSRITSPTEGSYRYRGRLISLLEVGTGFHADLSGRDNIYLNAAINGMSHKAIKSRFDEIVEFSELGEHINSPVKRYSSGMYMRLAFSVAAHLESEILVVDEVLAVGDVGFQKKCKDKMLEVAGHGRTLLFVSHDMNAVKNICSQAITLSHGEIVPYKSHEEGKSNADYNKTSAMVDVGIATSSYLSSNLKPNSEKIWQDDKFAPHLDHCVRLLSVKILSEEEGNKATYDINEPITVEVEFKISQAKYNLNVQIHLFTLSGEKILLSMDNLDISDPKMIRPSGRYIQRCVIPSPFLNAGVYRLGVSIKTYMESSYSIEIMDALSFVVTDDMLPNVGVRGCWLREWESCILRPRFQWDITYVPEEIKNLEQPVAVQEDDSLTVN